MLEIQQVQGAQFYLLLPLQQGFELAALDLRHKGHRRLHWEAHALGTGVGRQPELDFGAGRGIAPMPGQDEALL